VRARILVDGPPWLASDTVRPVLRTPDDLRIDILMRQVAAPY
jgi:hypothetical protein